MRSLITLGGNVARRKAPADQPDALIYSEDGSQWAVFCALCPRQLGKVYVDRNTALWRAHEHLEHSHALLRVWIGHDRPAHLQLVQGALPLIIAHDRTLTTDRWAR